LIEFQPRVGTIGTGTLREEYIAAAAADIIAKIPEPFDRIKLVDLIPTPTPTQVVLLQEVEAWNNLVIQMTTSLKNLQRALKGEIGMSAELDELSISLYNGTLPSMWAKYAPATKMKLPTWLEHFYKRYKQYEKWIATKEDPVVMWLSGLHTPESYLTALVQVTCKKYKWPLDRTTLTTRVTKWTNPDEVKEKPQDGCYVHGLYLEGAGWDVEKGVLRRQKPKELYCIMPVMEVIPVENSKLKLQNTFRTPVYVTPDRRGADGVGLVFEADLPTFEHQSHWVLQGVALMLNYE
jgi:dynein heavy chain